jgi:signal transduction histidine kinase
MDVPLPRPHSLATRFVVTFAAFVVAGSLLLLAWLRHQQQAEHGRVFLMLAQADANFVQRMNLPRSAKLADDLGRLLRMQIHFRDEKGLLEPALTEREAAPLKTLTMGVVHELPGQWQALMLKLDARHDMIFIRRTPEVTLSLWRPATRNALLAFWLLSAALGWVIARQVVRPVQQLTRGLGGFFASKDYVPAGAERGDEIGELARALAQARDDLLDERLRREQSERMALLGRMATGLAHEIKNPLASIQLHAQLMDVDAMDAESAQSIQLVQSEARVIEGLVNQWLYLTRPVPPKMQMLDVSEILTSTVAALTAQADHAGVLFVWSTGFSRKSESPDLLKQVLQTFGDRARLQQVFRNIMLNGIQAMPHGGALEIEVERSDKQWVFRFRDHGQGFSAAAMAHGAELFFSEKEGGIGVGLNVAQEIITAHGGTICLRNHPEGGAVVELALPLAS